MLEPSCCFVVIILILLRRLTEMTVGGLREFFEQTFVCQSWHLSDTPFPSYARQRVLDLNTPAFSVDQAEIWQFYITSATRYRD